MSNHEQSIRRKHLIFFSMAGMLAGLFLSRVLLSVSMMVFLSAAIAHRGIAGQLRRFISSPLYWSVSFLFLLPLLSGLWSAHTGLWLDNLRIKLPLLLFPLAFAGDFGFQRKDWERIALLYVAACLAGSIWSAVRYFVNMDAVHAGYLRSEVFRTPLHNDHVRFSWMVAVSVLFVAWLLKEYRARIPAFQQVCLWLVLAWLFIYLHVLSARTGLLGLYAMLFCSMLWYLFRAGSRRVAIAGFIILAGVPLLAYILLPTFRNRVRFMQYDYGYFSEAHYKPGLNDAKRVISLKMGWALMNRGPAGSGFGDLWQDAREWYRSNYPDMKNRDRILPGSEPLVYGAGCGWIGFLCFFAITAYPFFLKRNLLWMTVNIAIFLAFLSDITLEVQFGVFLYVFTFFFTHGWVHEILKTKGNR